MESFIEITISECKTNEEIIKTFPIMSQLRPHLIEETYCENVNELIKTEQYHLVSLDVNKECLGCAGYRIRRRLFLNLEIELYIDDLIIDSNHRSKGYGKLIIEWLNIEAKKNNYKYITLDSGLQRTEAHKFYTREGFSNSSYSFIKQIIYN